MVLLVETGFPESFNKHKRKEKEMCPDVQTSKKMLDEGLEKSLRFKHNFHPHCSLSSLEKKKNTATANYSLTIFVPL